MQKAMHLPVVRDILPPFVLPDEWGNLVDLERFRQQRNLVLIFVRNILPATESVLRELAAVPETLAEEEGEVLVIARNQEEAANLRRHTGSSLTILIDEAGAVVDAYCPADFSVYITDRFREIFTAHHREQLSCEQILEWLAHINRQCPE